jgi:hypothetical protein
MFLDVVGFVPTHGVFFLASMPERILGGAESKVQRGLVALLRQRLFYTHITPRITTKLLEFTFCLAYPQSEIGCVMPTYHRGRVRAA